MPIVHFPDKTLEIGQRQVELLVSMKIVTPNGNHEFEGTDSERALTVMIEHPETMKCDFCGETPVVYEYPSNDFFMVDTDKETQNSIGSWMACKLCSERIELGDTEGLSERAIEAHTDPSYTVEQHIALDLMLRGLHRSFMEHRTGPGKRI